MVSELRLDNILPLFWLKNCPKTVEIAILVYFDGFSAKHESDIIQAQFWDHIWNPLIKTNLLDPIPILKKIWNLFFDIHSIFKISFLVREPKKQFYGRKMSLFCYLHPMAREQLQIPGKSWVRWKMIRPIGHRERSTISGKCLTEAVKWEVEA